MEISIKRCNKLIVNSNYSKKEIINLLNIDVQKVHVVHLGVSNDLKVRKVDLTHVLKFDYNSEYILSVISCVKYHNIINMLKGYKMFKSKYNSNIRYVIITQILDKEYFKEIKNFIFNNFSDDEVKILINIDSELLPKFYMNSKMYFFSSYSEVFGLTSLEAMCFGCKILVSNKSALPEINGSIANYFNPDDIQDICESIQNILHTKNVKEWIQTLIITNKL